MKNFQPVRAFRIERSKASGTAANTASTETDSATLATLAQSIDLLRMEVRELKGQATQAKPTGVDPDAFRQQVLEADRLKSDLEELSAAIERTKQEILSMRVSGEGGDKIYTASEALRAVVGDTETSTNNIINAAEGVEEIAGRLRAQLNDDDSLNLVDDLFQHATSIFENCNFQDITGQRITKVVNTMEFIDKRINRMMEIWGGDSGFDNVEIEIEDDRPIGEVLLGPAVEGDGSIGQDDIDALFD